MKILGEKNLFLKDMLFLINVGLLFTDSFEMLKALYDFQAVYPKTISFFEGEHFILHQTSVKQRNWWQVINMKGSIGFVPSNYVNKIKVGDHRGCFQFCCIRDDKICFCFELGEANLSTGIP